jgi:hypothetical protein
MTEEPTPTTVRVEPETLITDVVPDEYVKVPGTEPVTDGAVTVKAASPKFLATSLQAENVGVTLGAVGRSELNVAKPVIAGVAPVPVLEKPPAVGFKKMIESAGVSLVLGYGKLAEKLAE